jgi:glycosyltransferase involved in cell wall biosynthesis
MSVEGMIAGRSETIDSAGRPRVGILQITSYPPPRAGWGVRVQFLKKYLEARGHRCVVLNIGASRAIPSDEYETVLGGFDYIRKVWRFSREGLVAHVHVNGASPKGFVLAIAAQLINLVSGRRSFLTFHAGINQVYFPRPKYPLLWPVFWTLFAIPRHIICNSEEVKAKIVEYGVPPHKVAPIPAFSTQYLDGAAGVLPQDVDAFYQRCEHIVFSYTKMRPMFYPDTLVEGFARFAATHKDAGLVLCGIAGHMEPGVWESVQQKIAALGIADRTLVVDDLPHEAFLQALGRATVYLRTHVSDGVCSSVMEALALGVPVVATENANRPPGVITYPPEDSEALARHLADVIARRDEIVSALERPDVRDTLAEEARLLTE